MCVIVASHAQLADTTVICVVMIILPGIIMAMDMDITGTKDFAESSFLDSD